MIKVECVSCKSAYDVDERRVPDKGMKMRCPKCATSFMVAPDGTTSTIAATTAGAGPLAPPLAAGVGLPPPPAFPIPPKLAGAAKTLVGQQAPELSAPPLAPVPVPAPSGAKLPKGTMLGMQAPAASVPDASSSHTDLPAVKPAAKPPVPWGSLAPPALDTPAAPARPIQPNLPKGMATPAAGAIAGAVAGPKAGGAASAFGTQLHAPAQPKLSRAADQVVDPLADLPAPKASPMRARHSGHAAGQNAGHGHDAPDGADLPALRKPRNVGAMFGEVDLPEADLEVDLPAPKRATSSEHAYGEIDLPAPKAAPARPASPGFGDLDLPALKPGAELPVLKNLVDLPAAKQAADLPARKNLADLPAPKNLTDLPAPKNLTDLPAPKNLADLPTPKQLTDLPTRAGGGFGELDLPVPKGSASSRGEDESSFGDIDLPDLPDLDDALSVGGFGDIELPSPRAAKDLVPPKAPTFQGVGSPVAARNDESSFGDLNVGDSMPPSLMSDDESSFGDLNPDDALPSVRPLRMGAPAIEGSVPPALREDDLEEDPGLEDDDDFGEAPFGDYGEEDSEEDMEFGIADGDDAGLPPEIMRRQRGEDTEAADVAKSKRALHVLAGVAVLLVIVGATGAGLGFTDYGFFGKFYLERYLPEAGDPAFARQSIARAEKTASTDTYRDARRSLTLLGEARHKKGLNRELLTRSLLHEALYQVRFGADPRSSSHMAALLARLEERHGIAPGMDLARAADAARRAAYGEVGAHLAAARAQASKDPYVDLIAGEVALREGKLDASEKAFNQALRNGGAARAQWGLARVALSKPDEAAQLAAIEETLKLSSLHVEARIAQARIFFRQGREDRAMEELRQALGLEPIDNQFLWTAKPAQALGHGLMGYMHETRGRLHLARKAYEEALSADPYLVDALLGAGRVLLRERRASDALARFESALNIAQKSPPQQALSGRPADIEARLGQGRALLALSRGPDAKGKLVTLMSEQPNDPEIVLAAGQAEELLRNREEAEKLMRKAIDLAPNSFASYLALSQFYFKQNQPDKASETLNSAAAKVEESAEMRRMLGQSELARNRLDSAIHEFKRAAELDPQDLDARFGLGIAYRRTGQLQTASALFDDIGKRDPQYAGLTLERGQLFEAQGEYGKAVENYRNALTKDASDTGLLLRLGAAQVEAGQLDEAEQTLDEVIRQIPNSAEAEHFIGRIAFARSRGPDALTHFDRALSLDNTQAVFHLYAARAALEMSNLGRTLDEIELTIARDDSLGDAYWVRGIVRMRMGAVKDALKDLHRALQLKPSRTEAYASIAECHDELRQLPQAVQAFRTALSKHPEKGEWWYKLGRLHLDMGERKASSAALEKAIDLGTHKEAQPYWLPDAYRLSGEIARAENNRKAAISSYQRYLEIAPDGALDRTEVRKILRGWEIELDR